VTSLAAVVNGTWLSPKCDKLPRNHPEDTKKKSAYIPFFSVCFRGHVDVIRDDMRNLSASNRSGNMPTMTQYRF
jgi:hypothetical protein